MQHLLQVYSASLDGTLRLWDLSTRACLSVAHVREAVQHMALHASLRLAYLSIDWRDGASGRVISWHLDRGRAGASALKTRSAGPLAMNSRGERRSGWSTVPYRDPGHDGHSCCRRLLCAAAALCHTDDCKRLTCQRRWERWRPQGRWRRRLTATRSSSGAWARRSASRST